MRHSAEKRFRRRTDKTGLLSVDKSEHEPELIPSGRTRSASYRSIGKWYVVASAFRSSMCCTAPNAAAKHARACMPACMRALVCARSGSMRARTRSCRHACVRVHVCVSAHACAFRVQVAGRERQHQLEELLRGVELLDDRRDVPENHRIPAACAVLRCAALRCAVRTIGLHYRTCRQSNVLRGTLRLS
jgi:hypothetical protein